MDRKQHDKKYNHWGESVRSYKEILAEARLKEPKNYPHTKSQLHVKGSSEPVTHILPLDFLEDEDSVV